MFIEFRALQNFDDILSICAMKNNRIRASPLATGRGSRCRNHHNKHLLLSHVDNKIQIKVRRFQVSYVMLTERIEQTEYVFLEFRF
jgi:hypothetical protein